MRKTVMWMVIIALIALSLSGCTAPAENTATTTAGSMSDTTQGSEPADATEAPQAVGEKTLTVAMVNAWDSLMPMNSNSNYGDFVFSQIYSKLVQIKADGSYAGDLAESWQVNDDSTEVTFTLNADAVWHDGEPVTAEDVVFSFKLFSNPAVEAVSRYYLAVIDGTDESGAETAEGSIAVEMVDQSTVVIKMKNAMYPGTLLMNLNSVYIIPKHIYETKTVEEINNPESWANPIGSGPFSYVDKIEGERIEFKKNEAFYLGAPKIDKLVVRIVPGQNLLSSLMSGDVDLLLGGLAKIPLDDWALAQEQSNLMTESIPSTNYQTLILNTQKPYMTQTARQAISMAVNRDALVNALLQGEGVSLIAPIVPSNPYYNADVKVWYDPDKAVEMLKAEGFPFDQELVFLVPSGNTTRERAAALIQQDLTNIGLNVRIQMVDFPTLMNSMREGSHDIGIIGSGGTPDPGESRQMIDPASPVNFSLLETTELADLIDKGNAELTFEKQLPYFKDYQAKVKELSAMPYLYATNMLMAYNKRVTGVEGVEFLVMNWQSWLWDVEQ